MIKEEKEISKIKNKLFNLKAMIPGTLSKQWNVCGNAGCKCKDSKQPVKHGPYYQLSFSLKDKSSSFFVKEKDLDEVRKCMEQYKQFKKLNIELTQAYIELARKKGIKRS
ncbi:MAG: hypothetical protein H8D45_05975 [Bacteroidetes bacterium]|nr:hypothetical protein [Bacteroidota bacterium]